MVLDCVFIGEICGYKTLETKQKKINKLLLFGKFEFCFSPFASHRPPRISGLSSEFIQFSLRTCDPLWPTAFTVGFTCILYASGFLVSRSVQAAFDAAKTCSVNMLKILLIWVQIA